MTDNQQLTELVEKVKVFISLTDTFHNVNHLIPDDQQLLTIPAGTTVNEALAIMRKNHYSQLPVITENRKVLGVFSYRSFSETIVRASTGKDKPDLNKLSVKDFLEKAHYIQIFDDIEEILPSLDERDYLLVGRPERLIGIITISDLARFFYRYAYIFILLSEIELTIKKIIQICLEDEQFRECAQKALNGKYKNLETLDDMTFNDFILMITNKEFYPQFEVVFGQGELHRKRAIEILTDIRNFRNDAFHFKREMNNSDISILLGHQYWLKVITTDFEEEINGDEL
ncbi:MAG: CBS domain-containing protein [Bellilinea sp.]